MKHDAQRPIRVLMLIHDLGLGGAEVAMANLAEALSALGGTPMVCAWRNGGALEERLRAANVVVESPPHAWPRWTRLHAFRRLRQILQVHRIDVIHAHLSDSAVWGVVLQRLSGRPCVITHHSNSLIDGVGAGRPSYGWLRQKLLLACARRASANIGVSCAIATQLADLSRPTRPPVVIPNAVPLPPPAAVAKACAERYARWKDSTRGLEQRLLYAGRFDEQKDLETLLAAVPIIVARLPRATLTLLGDGPLRGALSRRAAQLQLGEHVIVAGPVADVSSWLRAADVFVSASRLEGLSVAVLEAMSWGVPVVVSDIPGHREVVHDGSTGLLVPTGAPQQLAEAVIATVRDPVASAARVQHALDLVRSQYSIEAAAQKHLALYDEIRAKWQSDGDGHSPRL